MGPRVGCRVLRGRPLDTINKDSPLEKQTSVSHQNHSIKPIDLTQSINQSISQRKVMLHLNDLRANTLPATGPS